MDEPLLPRSLPLPNPKGAAATLEAATIAIAKEAESFMVVETMSRGLVLLRPGIDEKMLSC